MAHPVSLSMVFSPPQTSLIRCILFLALISFPIFVLIPNIYAFFLNNPALNGLILFALILGILHAFYQILRLNREIAWVNYIVQTHLRNNEYLAPVKAVRRPNLLAPLASLLERQDNQPHYFSTTTARFLLDSISLRLEDARGVSRYLIGLLIFLGLLGTFWGLLETVSAIGDTVRSLGNAGNDALSAFSELRAGLEAPLAGMGTAFSSSLFGLAGSLILGFLDLQAGQAQGRFYTELEEFVSGMTQMDPGQAATTPVSPDSLGNQAHILEDIRRILMVAEGERALAGRNLETIARSLRHLSNDKGDKPSDKRKEML